MSFTLSTEGLFTGLLGDPELAEILTDDADLAAILRFEAALAKTQAALGLIPDVAAEEISTLCISFEPNLTELKTRVCQDGLVVPGLVTQLRAALSSDHAPYVHFKTTSQDAIDTSLMLRMGQILDRLDGRISTLLHRLGDLKQEAGSMPLMAHTRMQAALPITVGDRIASWTAPLKSLQADSRLLSQKLCLQLAGPVGVLDFPTSTAAELRRQLAAELNLTDPEGSWQTDRSRIVDIGNWLVKLTGGLGKLGQDIALMAQANPPTVRLAKGGSSSAMPHKNNPIQAEVLVTLARYSAAQMVGLQAGQLHEQERSGAAWTLEWLTLPPLVIAAGAASRNAEALLKGISFPTPIH